MGSIDVRLTSCTRTAVLLCCWHCENVTALVFASSPDPQAAQQAAARTAKAVSSMAVPEALQVCRSEVDLGLESKRVCFGFAIACVSSTCLTMHANQVLNLVAEEGVPMVKATVLEQYRKYYAANDVKKGGSLYLQAKIANAKVWWRWLSC